MIRNLTVDSFCIFGAIIGPEEKTIRSNHHSISLSVGNTWSYRTNAETWIGPETGLVILSVSTDGGQFQDFFLDRPVLLKENVWFCLTAFREVSSVQLAAVLLPGMESVSFAGRDLTARPQLRIHRILTLHLQELEQDYLFPGESHPAAELLYVDEGSLHCAVQGQDFLLNKGELVLYSPGQWHMQYAPQGQAPRIIGITFEAQGVPWQRLENQKFSPSPSVLMLMWQMLKEQETMDACSQDMIFCLLTQLLLHLLRQKPGTSQAAQMPQNVRSENEIIRRAQQYVAEYVCSKLTVPVVAQGVGVSASYLTALFHKHMQIAPAEYIRRMKLQKSRQMIREGSLNFTQIAESLQYSTVHHFSRQFKDKFGITPSEYARTVGR